MSYETEGRFHHMTVNPKGTTADCITNVCAWDMASSSCHSAGRCLYAFDATHIDRDCTSQNK